MGEITINPIHNVHKKYRTMNLVNSYDDTPPVIFNTYIGGVSTISTASALATILGISSSRIDNFTIIGSDIKCKITGGSYVMTSGYLAFPSSFSYFDDRDGLVTGLSGLVRDYPNLYYWNTPNGTPCPYFGRSCPLLKEAIFPTATSVLNSSFYESLCSDFYIPIATTIGNSTGNDSVFFLQGVGKTIYCNPLLATSNGGSEEADIAAARSAGATIRYVTNFTLPNAINSASVGTIYNTAIQLIDNGTSTNAIEYYEDVTVNGVNIGKIKVGRYIVGLSPSTSYSITAKSVDILRNKSAISSVVSATTNTSTIQRLYQKSWFNASDLKFYLKLDADSNDYNTAYNGTPTDIIHSTSSSNGFPIDTAKFNGSTSKITLPDAATYNDSQTIVCWIKSNNTTGGGFYSKGSDASDGWGLALKHTLSVIGMQAVTLTPTAGWSYSVNDSKKIGEYFHFAFTYNNTTDIFAMWINGIKIGETTKAGSLFRGSTNVFIGVLRLSTGYTNYLNGEVADFAVIKRVLTDLEITSLQM